MPYIKQTRRLAVDRYLHGEGDASEAPQDCGELNYALTMTCLRNNTIKLRELDRKLGKIVGDYAKAQPFRYQRINDIVGACLCASLELRARIAKSQHLAASLSAIAVQFYGDKATPYEKTKIAENGDIIEYGSPRP